MDFKMNKNTDCKCQYQKEPIDPFDPDDEDCSWEAVYRRNGVETNF